jgi:uncharacterized membrane protein YfcA
VTRQRHGPDSTLARRNWVPTLARGNQKWGGLMSGLVGIDIVTFSVMVLLFRISEKIATPTSVILMALNAVIGLY